MQRMPHSVSNELIIHRHYFFVVVITERVEKGTFDDESKAHQVMCLQSLKYKCTTAATHQV